MAINFDDKNIYNSIASIRDAKDSTGNEVFSREQRINYFSDFLVTSTEIAREIAKTLIKIKDYKKIKKTNLGLVGELELARSKNTLVYRVLNKEYLMDITIA